VIAGDHRLLRFREWVERRMRRDELIAFARDRKK
jgi:hypothetical protein